MRVLLSIGRSSLAFTTMCPASPVICVRAQNIGLSLMLDSVLYSCLMTPPPSDRSSFCGLHALSTRPVPPVWRTVSRPAYVLLCRRPIMSCHRLACALNCVVLSQTLRLEFGSSVVVHLHVSRLEICRLQSTWTRPPRPSAVALVCVVSVHVAIIFLPLWLCLQVRCNLAITPAFTVEGEENQNMLLCQSMCFHVLRTTFRSRAHGVLSGYRVLG